MKTSGESCGACEVADPLESRLLKPKEPGGFNAYCHHLPCSLASELRVTVDRMEVIEAEFNDGVLRPVRRLRLRPGERVGIVVVRRPDPLRWDLARLSKVISDEDTLTEAGLAEWEATLSHEDRR